MRDLNPVPVRVTSVAIPLDPSVGEALNTEKYENGRVDTEKVTPLLSEIESGASPDPGGATQLTSPSLSPGDCTVEAVAAPRSTPVAETQPSTTESPNLHLTSPEDTEVDAVVLGRLVAPITITIEPAEGEVEGLA